MDLADLIERAEESVGLIVVGRPFFYSGPFEGIQRVRAQVHAAGAQHALPLIAPSNAPPSSDVDVIIAGVVGTCLAAARVGQPVVVPRGVIETCRDVLPPALSTALESLPGFAWEPAPAGAYLTSIGWSGAALEAAGTIVCATWADEEGYAAIAAESLAGLDEIQLIGKDA